MTSATKDTEGTLLSPPHIRDNWRAAPWIIFLERAGREERGGGQVILTGQTERSRVAFEVLAGRGS